MPWEHPSTSRWGHRTVASRCHTGSGSHSARTPGRCQLPSRPGWSWDRGCPATDPGSHRFGGLHQSTRSLLEYRREAPGLHLSLPRQYPRSRLCHRYSADLRTPRCHQNRKSRPCWVPRLSHLRPKHRRYSLLPRSLRNYRPKSRSNPTNHRRPSPRSRLMPRVPHSKSLPSLTSLLTPRTRRRLPNDRQSHQTS